MPRHAAHVGHVMPSEPGCRSTEALAAGCAATLHTLDVNGCTGIRRRSREQLQQALPQLRDFVVHT